METRHWPHLKDRIFSETFCDNLRIFQGIFTYFCTCKRKWPRKKMPERKKLLYPGNVMCRMQRGNRKDLGNSQIPRLIIRLQLQISTILLYSTSYCCTLIELHNTISNAVEPLSTISFDLK